MKKNPDRVEFVKLENGSTEDVTQEELETVSEWLDGMVKEAARRPRCPKATALE